MSVFRNGILILVGLISLMMALSALGVDIGPLIAGAGVAGIALGFGAQTVIKDIISGIFYLIDDAFRVGEYIQSGSYKGTVESFSLRSVRLRHHRGSLYTVPFSALGAIQNMSRDWVLEKISVGVSYDTDLSAVKKIVKDIGKELSEDPELGPSIIEPLKMQGVDEFSDHAVLIRLKFKTKPGDARFMIKRRAHALLKQMFDENGIKFAVPTVHVAGDTKQEEAAVAATISKSSKQATV
jgi:small-conductance mechanosensitive channel